ncbi:MAG: inositol monophosphatase [bacterium]|nr:inositol monophosphatase [bacterium]
MAGKYDEYLLFAKVIGSAAASHIEKNFLRDFRYEEKGTSDLVTDVDIYCEKLIYNAIRKTYPKHGVLAEEGNSYEGEGDWRWIVDPLDGTNNFAHGYPLVAVSIALEYRGEIVVAVVEDTIHRETFWAQKDGGASSDRGELKVSETTHLQRSMVSTGFPYDKDNSDIDNLGNWNRATKAVRGIRRGGSAALDLCYVASGRFDGFWELKLQTWDTAAGMLIITEAGGRVTRFDGSQYSIDDLDIIATNGRIHNELAGLLKIKG